MYEISSEIYKKAALRLCDQVGDGDYFSGTITFVHEEVECRMLLSIIIYHKRVEMPEGSFETIEDVVPVWWEFHTEIDGEEQINDFDFSLFKGYLL
ncbi:MAG: hypothetical protein J6Q20_03190 [Alistipes sp.]|nr:hypothetical protein [Alistipes sp.]